MTNRTTQPCFPITRFFTVPIQDGICTFHYTNNGTPPRPAPGVKLYLPGRPFVTQFLFTLCGTCLNELREAMR
jgi:hypothetical protein